VDREHLEWLARLAEAARRAAEDLRGLDDPHHHDLLMDLDDLHTRLTAELEATPPEDG
jgi:hypothetical protein